MNVHNLLLLISRWHIQRLLGILAGLIICAILGWLLILQFGLISRQASIPPEAVQIKQQIELMRRYPIRQTSSQLEAIVSPATQIPIRELEPGEIGKATLFE